MKVLVVEDNPDFSRLLKKALKASEFATKIRFASNGAEALAVIDMLLPDVIILDYCLPGHSAAEILHELVAHQDTRHLPVFIYSAHASNLIFSQQLYTNVRALDKTKVSPKELVQILQETIGAKNAVKN